MVGKKDKFLNAIALMSIEWRETRACLEVINIADTLRTEGLKAEQKKKLDVIKAIVERMGQANFQMDVVSHLAMKIGKAYKSYEGE